MLQKIIPFLWFDTQAEEAITFYTSIFKDSKIVSITRYPEGATDGPMKGMGGKVLTAVFELEGQRFMALDGGPVFKPSGAVSFYIECDGQEDVDYYWNRLSEGGSPEAQQCGWLMDKYGFSWQVIPKQLPELLTSSDKEKAGRAMQAMLQMKKIDIAGLQKAYDGQ
jgi:predicted 3-demethylubiquinone-9 3-methyltransferase (glyoxalase superfamily)